MCLQVSRASSGPLHMHSSFTLVYSRLQDTAHVSDEDTPPRKESWCALQRKRRASARFSLEVLGVLGQRHLDDIEAVVVVFLSREQQRQQVKRVNVVPLKLQRLPNIA